MRPWKLLVFALLILGPTPWFQVFIGIDFGTSGCRAACLNDAGELLAESSVAYGDDAGPQQWQEALHDVVIQLPQRDSAAAICIDGTSATVMLCHRSNGDVLAGPLMYNFSCQSDAVQRCRAMLPSAEHTASAPTSTLCKAWEFMLHGTVSTEDSRLVHQADWLLAQLLDDHVASPGSQQAQKDTSAHLPPGHVMGCALGSAADHAVAKATQRVEKDQVIEKAVQRALHAAVAELQHVEVTLRVSPRHNPSPAEAEHGAEVDAPVSPASLVSSPCSPGPSRRFLEKGVRRGRAADWCATSLSKAEQVIITEEGWSRFFYYAFASMDDAMEVFQAWPHTARVLYSFDASAGCLVQELEADAGASVGWSLSNIRGRAEALMLPDENEI
eukprot:s4473_g2.t1